MSGGKRKRDGECDALLASQTRPEPGVNDRFTVVSLRFFAQINAALSTRGRQMPGEVLLHGRDHMSCGGIPWFGRLGSSSELPRLGVYFDFFAFLDEQRYSQFHPGFEDGEFGDAAAAGVAPHRAFA